MDNNVLLIGDDPGVNKTVRSILEGEVRLSESSSVSESVKAVNAEKWGLVIFDYDMRSDGGLEGFRKLKRVDPHLKVLMISDQNDISAAVSAAKLGVVDFLRKPIEPERFKEAVFRNLAMAKKTLAVTLEGVTGVEWLKGISDETKLLLGAVESAVLKKDDILLFGEMGIDKSSVAKLIHLHGPFSQRRFVELDLRSFSREQAEGHFWVALKELLEEAGGDIPRAELCGTLLLKGIENISEHFLLSVLEFLRKRRGPQNLERIDKGIRVILSIEDFEKLSSMEANGQFGGLVKIAIPTLSERKVDLPLLLEHYISAYCAKFDRSVLNISIEAVSFMMMYDWPGNFRELEQFISLAVLRAKGDTITLFDLPVDQRMLLSEQFAEAVSRGRITLEELRQAYEKKYIGLVLGVMGGDEGAASGFLDIPRTALGERAKKLGFLK